MATDMSQGTAMLVGALSGGLGAYAGQLERDIMAEAELNRKKNLDNLSRQNQYLMSDSGFVDKASGKVYSQEQYDNLGDRTNVMSSSDYSRGVAEKSARTASDLEAELYGTESQMSLRELKRKEALGAAEEEAQMKSKYALKLEESKRTTKRQEQVAKESREKAKTSSKDIMDTWKFMSEEEQMVWSERAAANNELTGGKLTGFEVYRQFREEPSKRLSDAGVAQVQEGLDSGAVSWTEVEAEVSPEDLAKLKEPTERVPALTADQRKRKVAKPPSETTMLDLLNLLEAEKGSPRAFGGVLQGSSFAQPRR